MSAPLPLAGLAVLSALYAHGVWRLGARRRPSIARWRLVSFVAGAIAVAVALLPPLDHLAEASLAAHMIQHLLLVVVGAPLMALGRPIRVIVATGPPARSVAGCAAARLRRLVDRPVHVWSMHSAVLWLWHVPGPYMAALHDPWLHALEHATLLGVGVLFWLVVAEPGAQTRLGSLPAAGYLFAAGMQCGVLGALLTLSETPWYPQSASGSRDSLYDQQLAGVLMWIPVGLVYLGAMLAIFAKPLHISDRRSG